MAGAGGCKAAPLDGAVGRFLGNELYDGIGYGGNNLFNMI